MCIRDRPDVIIVDPPREGIHPKAIGKIIDFGAPEIVYVSCKPTSLARDLQEFQAAGYEVKRVRLMDMFPRTCLLYTSFNKSHAACYAVVGYQTAWLKAHYPVEFMAALMTSVMDNASKVSGYIEECKKMGIQLLPPDINEGFGHLSLIHI